ncbi:MAG: hypothetical protein KTM48_00520, partial [Wolbachia endosymbiont of Pissodes strobi]|nr:hypothetical protein [Wolbachia endosymbiont of Pissodes strobi]
VHQLLCQQAELLEDFTPYHKYSPPPILENETSKIYWDVTIITDRATEHNRPDMVVWNKTEKSATLIDFAVPQDYNMAKTYAEKIRKYEQLAREVKQMWQLDNVRILPLIISVNGLVHKNTSKHISELNLPANCILWMQKAVILGTVRIVRQVISPF